ncbi:hypothetical protein Salat_1285000 [Sesamum alatum]|uniref:AIPP2-like SPOC-like domain-containing protein n=1 Tax=Sesamum alatum TaxID=300844 RepID=A0AAE2CPL6_9LAMI|nr:hypothetical protein Salat_1285000 [Sesamum alatum]
MKNKNTCLQCGDVGHKTSLVYCKNCLQCAVHRYCMDVMPKPNHKSPSWLCEDCRESKKFKKRRRLVLNQSDNEISAERVQTLSSKLGQKSFLHSFAGVRGTTWAEPLVRPVWTGSFDVWCNESVCRRMDGFAAHLSVKACEKVINEAAAFQAVMPIEVLPRSYVWPKSFEVSGPTDDNVAVYFFPSLMKYESLYDYLVFEMMRDDVAMRASVRNTELLIFTSIELPSRCRRFQGKLYLWGVFRAQQAAVVV